MNLKLHTTILGVAVTAILSGCANNELQRNVEASLAKGPLTVLKAESENSGTNQKPKFFSAPIEAPATEPVSTLNKRITYRGTVPNAQSLVQRLSGMLDAPIRITKEASTLIDKATIILDVNDAANTALDAITAQLGVSWRHTQTGIIVFLTETKVFQIDALAGTLTTSSSGGSRATTSTSSTQGSGSSSAGDSRISLSQTVDFFAATTKAISSMLSTHGKVVEAAQLGTVTVTDTPDSLARVEDYVSAQNHLLTARVALEIVVGSFSSKDSSNYGIDFSLLYSQLSDRFNLRIDTNNAVQAVGNTFSFLIPPGVAGSAAKLSGSQALFSALANQGTTKQQHTATLSTINRIPVSFSNVREVSYIARAGTSLVSSGTNASQANFNVEPGVKDIGITLSATPLILSGGNEILLTTSLTMTNLVDLRLISQGAGSNATRIEFPEVDGLQTLQVSRLGNGETLVLTGFERSVESVDKAGVAPKSSWFGSERVSQRNEKLIIAITPVIMFGKVPVKKANE